MPAVKVLGIAAVVFIASATIVTALRQWLRSDFLDIPGQRSSHTVPTPRGGGIAIVFSSGLAAIAFSLLLPSWMERSFVYAVIGAGVVAIVSWFDDIHSLSWQVRLLAHACAATMFAIAAGPITTISIPFVVRVTLWWSAGLLISLLWVVGLTNAYNFMDGIDGIAAGQAIAAGAGWALIGWNMHQGALAMAGLTLAASSAGFLIHNWPPASVFMGDVGSAFLGYSFAALTLIAARLDPVLLWCGVLMVWPFLFDTVLTFFRRLQRGERVFSAHRSHLYQRLVISGMTHGQVSLIYTAAAAIGVGAATSLQQHRWMLGLAFIVAIVAVAASIYVAVVWREARLARSGDAGRTAVRRDSSSGTSKENEGRQRSASAEMREFD